MSMTNKSTFCHRNFHKIYGVSSVKIISVEDSSLSDCIFPKEYTRFGLLICKLALLKFCFVNSDLHFLANGHRD